MAVGSEARLDCSNRAAASIDHAEPARQTGERRQRLDPVASHGLAAAAVSVLAGAAAASTAADGPLASAAKGVEACGVRRAGAADRTG